MSMVMLQKGLRGRRPKGADCQEDWLSTVDDKLNGVAASARDPLRWLRERSQQKECRRGSCDLWCSDMCTPRTTDMNATCMMKSYITS